MSIFETITNIFPLFGRETGKIGLSQFKQKNTVKKEVKRYNKQKDIKLSDLMRRSG